MIDEDRVHDDPNIEATVLRYLPFLRRECAKVPARVHPPGWDLEDLVQESLAWALVQARRYNPDRGASLETWVGNCMRWAPRTVSQRAHGVPNSAIDRAGDIRRAPPAPRSGRLPTDSASAPGAPAGSAARGTVGSPPGSGTWSAAWSAP